MPRANPATSFDAAVRHLFRYLNDADQLKRNPLVDRFFQPPSNVNRAYQTGIIRAIRSLLDAGAKAYGDAATFDEKLVVERQLAIFYGCIQKRTIEQLANELQFRMASYMEQLAEGEKLTLGQSIRLPLNSIKHRRYTRHGGTASVLRWQDSRGRHVLRLGSSSAQRPAEVLVVRGRFSRLRPDRKKRAEEKPL